MLLIVIHILCGFLALIGVMAVIQGVYQRLTDIPDDRRCLLVVLQGEDADVKLQSAAEQVRRGRIRVDGGIVAVDAGLSGDLLPACRMIADDMGFVSVLTVQECQQWLGGIAGGQNVSDPGNGGEDHVL